MNEEDLLDSIPIRKEMLATYDALERGESPKREPFTLGF